MKVLFICPISLRVTTASGVTLIGMLYTSSAVSKILGTSILNFPVPVSCAPPGIIKLLFAITYLVHWFIVIPWVTLKMAIFPKRLVWAKTIHKGN